MVFIDPIYLHWNKGALNDISVCLCHCACSSRQGSLLKPRHSVTASSPLRVWCRPENQTVKMATEGTSSLCCVFCICVNVGTHVLWYFNGIKYSLFSVLVFHLVWNRISLLFSVRSARIADSWSSWISPVSASTLQEEYWDYKCTVLYGFFNHFTH